MQSAGEPALVSSRQAGGKLEGVRISRPRRAKGLKPAALRAEGTGSACRAPARQDGLALPSTLCPITPPPMKKFLLLAGSLTVAALSLSRLSAQSTAPTLEDRLQLLEQKVQRLATENADLRKQLGGKDGAAPVLVRPGAGESKLTVGGFLHGQAEFGRASDPRWTSIKDRFFFRRARIYVAGTLAEDFDFKAELDLQGNSLSASTGLNARANEIFLNWRKYSYLNLRFGQLKPGYGAEALASDLKILTIERSLSSDRLADGRQLAVGAAGELWDKKVSYFVIVGDGNGSNVSANDNSKFQKSAHVGYTPLATAQDKVTVGLGGLWSEDAGLSRNDLGLTGNLFTGKRAMQGVDLQWTHGRLDLSAEWLSGTFKPVTAVPAASFTAEGWHATAAYFLVPLKLQAVVREEQFDPNTATGGNTIRTFTFGLNYYLKGDDLKFMVDYLEGQVPGSLRDGGRLLTRLQVVF